jgi:hypothetical protein
LGFLIQQGKMTSIFVNQLFQMKVSKILIFAFGALLCLSVVVLTIRQIAIKDVPEYSLAIINAQVKTSDEKLVSAMLLKHDKIVAMGNDQEILKQRNEDTVVIDMQGQTIAPGEIAKSVQLESALSQGVTTLLLDVNETEAEEYYWGRQHGLYQVRVAVKSQDPELIEASDHKFIVNSDPNFMSRIGSLDVGHYADFIVLKDNKLTQTWVGAVKVHGSENL